MQKMFSGSFNLYLWICCFELSYIDIFSTEYRLPYHSPSFVARRTYHWTLRKHRGTESTLTKYNYAYFVDETGDQKFVACSLFSVLGFSVTEWMKRKTDKFGWMKGVRSYETWKRWKCNHTKTVDKKHINFVELNYVYQFCFPLMCLVSFACHTTTTRICLFSSRDDATEWWSVSRRSLSCF